MSFYDELVSATESERQYLLSAPAITETMAGEITLTRYLSFLTQAYHHVKHTTPLLMAVGSRLPERLEWLRDAVAEYIEEELGHQEWVLNDIAACGADKEAVRNGEPAMATELMVSYAWDTVMRRNPVSFFGMVLVLEGTSAAIASDAAELIARRLGLPATAFSYLASHGHLDQSHIGHLEGILNRLDTQDDRDAVVRCARMMYRLYGDVFRTLDNEAANASMQEVA